MSVYERSAALLQTLIRFDTINPPGNERSNACATIHAADERIPVEAVAFGADAMFEAIRRWGEG